MIKTKEYVFLAGLPRSGSTVLAAILNQNPHIFASKTSNLSSLLLATLQKFSDGRGVVFDKTRSMEEKDSEIIRILNGIIDSKYANVQKNIVVDKSRDWAAQEAIHSLTKLLGKKPKIIATVRNIPDCAASFFRVAEPYIKSPEEKEHFLRKSDYIDHLKESYRNLYTGYSSYPECFLFIEYENLIVNPGKELDRIHKFIGLDTFKYDFLNVEGSVVEESDEDVYGIKNLHAVRSEVKKASNPPAKEVLGYLYDDFDQFEFWDATNPTKKVSELDAMLEFGLRGSFQEAQKIGQKLLDRQPKNNRAAFNFGWYVLRDGHLLDGMKFIDRGRTEEVFGNPDAFTSKPKWDGRTKGTVLFFLEGGLGDQIHGARFIENIAGKGCDVVVSCSPVLFPIVKQLPNVTAICQEGSAKGIYHDFYAQSMSAVIPLKLQYADVKGSAYIPRLKTPRDKKFRIGLRWQGNPQFEHEQHRLFPSELLFNAVEGHDVEFISLQRDEGSEYRPKWVKEVCLDSWEDTQKAVSSCDLVISSCTSVAHLSAAMGVKTWIVVPILPYYLWAKPGKETEWYDSATLYRQKEYGNWKNTFSQIKKDLTEVLNNADYKDRVLGKSSERRGFAGLGFLSFRRTKAS